MEGPGRWPCLPCGAPYQLALRSPGTSPRMVASRSLLRPRPNLRYTPRERPDISQRLRWRDGLESRGSFCSFTEASSFSSYEAVSLLRTFFRSSRFCACFLTSLARFSSRSIIEVLAITVYLCPESVAERELEGFQQCLRFLVAL